MVAREEEVSSDFDIIEASYRLVADSSAFDDVIKCWMTRIDEVDDRQIALLDDPMIVRHLKAVTRLFEQIEPEDDDRIALATTGIDGPAAVLNREGTVVAANQAAMDLWRLGVEESAGTGWIDTHSVESFDAVRRSAARGGNHRHAILRTIDDAATSRLAECYIIDAYDGGPGLVAVRALDLRWNGEVATTLSNAFGLTAAELEICRLLLDTRDTSQIAALRGSSVHTVRTQLRTIFAKTETNTQVDLIRMVALVCSRSVIRKPEVAAGWEDPLGNEEIFYDRDGNAIAFSWVGDCNGRPALLCHGMATGYLLAREGIDELHASCIKLYLLSRPGFGNSDAVARGHPLDAAANAIIALAEHLGIESWTGIGHSAGLPPLVCAAANPASRLKSLIGAAAYLPYRRSESFQTFPPARKIAFRLARNSQLMADLVGRFCYRMAVIRNADFLNEYMYSDCDADRMALRNPECAAMIAAAGRFMITHQHRAVAGDLRIMAADWSDALRNCPVPIQLLHGEDDPVNRIAEVRLVVDAHPNLDLTVFPNCGELLFWSHSPEIVKALTHSN